MEKLFHMKFFLMFKKYIFPTSNDKTVKVLLPYPSLITHMCNHTQYGSTESTQGVASGRGKNNLFIPS